MASDARGPVDLWDVLEEAELTVERWPLWQQRYEADIFSEEIISWDSEWWSMTAL